MPSRSDTRVWGSKPDPLRLQDACFDKSHQDCQDPWARLVWYQGMTSLGVPSSSSRTKQSQARKGKGQPPLQYLLRLWEATFVLHNMQGKAWDHCNGAETMFQNTGPVWTRQARGKVFIMCCSVATEIKSGQEPLHCRLGPPSSQQPAQLRFSIPEHSLSCRPAEGCRLRLTSVALSC